MAYLPGIGEVYMSGDPAAPKKTKRTWEDALPDKDKIKEYPTPAEPLDNPWIDDTEELSSSEEERIPTVAEEIEAKRLAEEEYTRQMKERIEEDKQKAMLKAIPVEKPEEESEAWERISWLIKTGEVIGTFTEDEAVDIFKETGRVVIPKMPSSVKTLTVDEVKHLREVNCRSYENWLKAGGKILGQYEGNPFKS